MKGTLIVRKYKNRRLYDTERSCYITREELCSIIREGRNVQVQEAGTSNDITVEMLLQLLMDEASEMNLPITPEFLHFILRSNHHMLTRLFRDFMPQFLQFFQSQFSAGASQNNAWPMSPMAGMGQFWNPWFSSAPQQAPTENPSDNSEIEQLQKRLQEMESQLKHLKGNG